MSNFDYTMPSPSLRASGEKAWWADYRFWLGMACSALFLFLAFRKVQWPQLSAALQAVDWRYLLLAAVVFIVKQVVRGLRWQVLLAPLGLLKVRDAFAYLNIGHMANNLLPLRAGEVVRTVLLGEKTGFSKSAVLATIVVERLLDILVLVAFSFVLTLMMPIPPLMKQSALAFGAVGGLGVVGLWWVAGHVFAGEAQRSSESKRVMHFGGSKLSGLVQKVHRLGRSFVSGLAVVRSPGQSGAAVGYSTLAWGLGVGSTWLVMRACHLDLPLTAALLVVVVVNLGAAIPSSPGFIGVVHFLAVVALAPWAVERSAALGFAIVFHAQSFLITVGLGVVYLGLERKSFSKLLDLPMARGVLQSK